MQQISVIAAGYDEDTGTLHILFDDFTDRCVDVERFESRLKTNTAAFTLNVYGHVSEKMKRDSAARMDAFIRSVSKPSNLSKNVSADDKA